MRIGKKEGGPESRKPSYKHPDEQEREELTQAKENEIDLLLGVKGGPAES